MKRLTFVTLYAAAENSATAEGGDESEELEAPTVRLREFRGGRPASSPRPGTPESQVNDVRP